MVHKILVSLGVLLLVSSARAQVGPSATRGAPPVANAARAAKVTVTSDTQRREGDRIIAEGSVDIRYREVVLQADYVEIDSVTKDLVAVGDVVLLEGTRRMIGERLELNLETRIGQFWEAWGYSDPDVYFSAKEVYKKGENSYDLRHAWVTSCNQPRPQWRLKASHVHYEADKYVRLWNARLEVFGVPVFYLPFFQFPAKRDRSTGLLVPSIGTNNQRGFYVANGFFWAIGRSYDATVTHEWYKDGGNSVYGEFRYVPSENMNGVLSTEHARIDDAVSAQYRWTHNQRVGTTWRLGATVDIATDDIIDRQYSRSVSRLSRRFRLSRGFVERNWDKYSFSLEGVHQVSFVTGSEEDTRYQLPSVGFSVRETNLLGPLYGSAGIGAVYFGSQPPGSDVSNWGRVDFAPTLRMPLHPVPWLEIRPSAGYRATYYTKSFEPDSFGQTPTDDPFFKQVIAGNIAVIGPIVQRVFHTPGNSYSEKFKHLIEPEVSYTYASNGDPHRQGQSADRVDSFGRAKVSRLGFTLRNRLFAKPILTPGGVPTPHELLLFELATFYDFERQSGDELQPLLGNVRLVPTRQLTTTYRFRYDLKETFFQAHSLQGTWRRRAFHTDVTFSRSSNVDQTTSSQVGTGITMSLFGDRLNLGGGVNYDLLNDDVQDLRSNLFWKTQCCGFGLGYRRFNLGDRDDSEVQFSISFKNVGTVFDYTLGGERR